MDVRDYYRFGNFNWHIGGHGIKFYAVRVIVDGDELKTLRLHREIMNPSDGLVVVIGVWFAKEKSKWESRITQRGKKIKNFSLIDFAAIKRYGASEKK